MIAAGSNSWALLLEYDGNPFVGWQRQAVGVSVQSVLEGAAARLCGGTAPACTVAGRTDAGVHAAGQVAMLRLPGPLRADQVRDALNHHMKPHPVVVLRAALAPDGWNPRFSATWRRYRFRILNRRARSALEPQRVWHVQRPLDTEAMARSAQHLLGRHDFTTFRASSCQAKSPVRTLDLLDIRRDGEAVTIHAGARSFLHHQVRNLVGSLAWVGHGRWTPEDMARALAARDRRAGGPTAPPEGLCLMEVRYPHDPFLAPFPEEEDGGG